MRIKYQRQSTSLQNPRRYDMDDDSYDAIYFDKGVSGTKPFKERTEAKKIIPLVESNQVKELVIEELRDLGRDTVDSINTLAWFGRYQVNIFIKSMGIQSMVDGKINPIWKLITSVMSSLYEMELENLKIRTKMGRDAYLKNGGKLGREKGSNETIKQFLSKPKSKNVISLLDKGKSVRDIASRLGISTNLVLKVRKHYLVDA
ncbi:recombinase family protein [Candidatus Kapabacteria bacterium]|nr:recombinase family protein [Candidatus Kapabacteria bacterium]